MIREHQANSHSFSEIKANNPLHAVSNQKVYLGRGFLWQILVISWEVEPHWLHIQLFIYR